MSLIDLASMVLAPTAVKDGKVYNAIPNDQDFTFSRGTEATRINSAGLIEKARTNFLLQSNTFDTTWQKYLTTLTSGQTGYDGSSNAWLLDKSASGFANIYQSVSTSGVLTASVYAKAGTNSTMILRCIGGTDAQGFFDLSNGTIEAPSANCIDAQINAVGNGWYRCSITFNTSSTTSVNIYPEYPFAGTTSGNILIQDAQLEQGLVATDVITTTTSSVTVGITDNLPRVDYSGGGCPSLLLEGSRTQILTQSEYFDTTPYSKVNATVTTNDITSPEGQINATKLISTSGASRVETFPTLSDNTNYTASIFAKRGDVDYIMVNFREKSGNQHQTFFDLANGTKGTTNGSPISSSIEAVGDYYRVTLTINSSSGGSTPRLQYLIANTDNNVVTSSGEYIYVYGAMLEAGSYVSSYIPSYGTSTSRSADSCNLTNASNLIGQSEGTLYWEVDFGVNDSSEYPAVFLYDGTSNNRILIQRRGNNSLLQYQVNAGGTNQVDEFSTTAVGSGKVKIAIAYKTNDFVLYLNGTQEANDTSGSTFSGALSQVSFENLRHDKTSQLVLFPTRLTNDQLAELTK